MVLFSEKEKGMFNLQELLNLFFMLKGVKFWLWMCCVPLPYFQCLKTYPLRKQIDFFPPMALKYYLKLSSPFGIQKIQTIISIPLLFSFLPGVLIIVCHVSKSSKWKSSSNAKNITKITNSKKQQNMLYWIALRNGFS